MGFYIDMIGVGYGDSFMLTLDGDSGEEYYVLVDGGPEGGGDRVAQHVAQYATGGLDLAIGTHLDDDHIGGLVNVLKGVPVRKLILNTPGTMPQWFAARELLKSLTEVASVQEMVKGVETADQLLKIAAALGIPVEQATQGDSWQVSTRLLLRVLNPTQERLAAAWAEEVLTKAIGAAHSVQPWALLEAAPPTTDANNASIVLSLEHDGETYVLLTGDAGADVLREVTAGQSYRFLKVSHHGSKTGLDEELLGQLAPHTAFIPVGNNPHGHPAREIREMLRGSDAKIVCSERVSPCYKDCRRDWGTVICHRGGGKPSRPDWSPIDSAKCPGNA